MNQISFPVSDIESLPHVLVIDDDERIRVLISRYLKDHGFVVMCAHDAANAKVMMERFVFDVLVVDVMMPGETGVEFTRNLRKKRDVPVLLLTALDEVEDRIQGLESGADDYLPKPFEPRELILRLRSLVRRSATLRERSGKFRLGGLVFDPVVGVFLGDDGSKMLTESEVRLLKALAAKSGEVVSRDYLAKACGVEGGGRSIDVQITRLRRKIEEDSKAPKYLQTVRGKGYRLHIEEI